MHMPKTYRSICDNPHPVDTFMHVVILLVVFSIASARFNIKAFLRNTCPCSPLLVTVEACL